MIRLSPVASVRERVVYIMQCRLRSLLPINRTTPLPHLSPDALNYGLYCDSRMLLVATPSGISLAPEGGAHQSINTPLISMAQPGLTGYEPSYADELAVIMRWGFAHMVRTDDGAEAGDGGGGSVYLRLSTRSLPQPKRTAISASVTRIGAEGEDVAAEGDALDILRGGRWLRGEEDGGAEALTLTPPHEGTQLIVAHCGVVAPEAHAAVAQLIETSFNGDATAVSHLQVTSPDLLYNGWSARSETAHPRRGNGGGGFFVPPGEAHAETLLRDVPRDAPIVSVLDGHAASLGWLGSVFGHQQAALGVSRFGQSGDVPDLYRTYGIDTEAIVDAATAALETQLRQGAKK